MLKIKDSVKYQGKQEIIKYINFKINSDVIDYHCAELEIEFESGNFYYEEITSYDYGIEYIRKKLFDNAEEILEKIN